MIGLRALLIGVAALGAALFIFSVARTAYLISVSKKLVESAEPYDRRSDMRTHTMLVVGDSTGVGVGATRAEESVAGRVAEHIGATYVENHAVSGAVINDLPPQIASAELDSYTLILVQIGANDIVRFRDAERSAEALREILKSLPPADKVLIISAGDVGTARLIPPPLRPFYTCKTHQFHAAFERVFPDAYVNLAEGPGSVLFETEPNVYLAADAFHPSAAGYGIWFDALLPHLGE